MHPRQEQFHRSTCGSTRGHDQVGNRSRREPGHVDLATRPNLGVEQRPSQGIDQVRLQLVSDATAAIAQIGQTQLFEGGAGRCGQDNLDRLVLVQAGQHRLDHRVEDCLRHRCSDEVEDDYILADPIEDLRPVENQLEMPIDLSPDPGLARPRTRSPG